MSRKRSKNKRPEEAAPEEVLAEGSGPNEVVDANAESLVAAAEELVEKRKGKRRKGKTPEIAPEVAPEVAPEIIPEVTAEVTADDEGAPAFDAAADNVLAESDDDEEAALAEAEAASDEQTLEALEDAALRAEAEAELGAADSAEAEAADEPDGELGAALPTTAATMDAGQLKNLVEALVFAADKPVTLQRLRQLTRVSDVKRLEQALSELAADYTSRGIALQVVSGGYQFRTNTQYSVWVQQLIAGRPVRLSRAQLETLAIVAYRQPITRPEIDEIRGVDSSATLRLLLDRSLIRTLGKKEDVGRPMLYGTTKEFLDFFSLNDLRELPTLREYSELTAESRKVMSDRLGVDSDAAPADSEGEEPEAPAQETAAEPSTDEVLAAYVGEEQASAAIEAVAAVDSSARPVIEVDAWGQVIGIPEDGARDDDMPVVSTSAEEPAAGAADDDSSTR